VYIYRVIHKSLRYFRSLRYSSVEGPAGRKYVRKRYFKILSYLTCARYVHPWSTLTTVSRKRSTVSADCLGLPLCFVAHRQSLCWSFMHHSRIVLSVDGSVWYKVRHIRYTVKIDSVFTNSKQGREHFFPPYSRHVSSRLPTSGETFNLIYACKHSLQVHHGDYNPNKLGQIVYIVTCTFLLCLSWWLQSRVTKYVYIYIEKRFYKFQ
jgi:hypothetical protein